MIVASGGSRCNMSFQRQIDLRVYVSDTAVQAPAATAPQGAP